LPFSSVGTERARNTEANLRAVGGMLFTQKTNASHSSAFLPAQSGVDWATAQDFATTTR
jgi:hypothetical protein